MLFETILAIGMITSAVFAIYLKETVASVLSLSTMMILLALLYFSMGAPFAALFQLALGTGTAAIFLLAGDSLTTKNNEKTPPKTKFIGLVAAAILCVPVVVGTITTTVLPKSTDLTLSSALWELRAIDVIAQGLVVLTVAIGVVLLLKQKRRQK